MTDLSVIRADRNALIQELTAAGAKHIKGSEVRCPYHDDANASGSVYQTDGVWRYKCHSCNAGGDVFDLQALRTGRPVAELIREAGASAATGKAPPPPPGGAKKAAPPPPPPPKASSSDNDNGSDRRIVKQYDYRDENGELLYQVVRFEPKGFSQRRPDPERPGKWIWSLQDVRRVLYRLPELLAAHSDTLVFVVEGEKDVDTLTALGLTATTSPQGAQKWDKVDPACRDYLGNRAIAIIPDNDDNGRKHAQQVAADLDARGAEVLVVELPDLPEHGDVSDWFAAGGTVERLIDIAEQAPVWRPVEGAENASEPEGEDEPVIISNITFKEGANGKAKSTAAAPQAIREVIYNRCGPIYSVDQMLFVPSADQDVPIRFLKDANHLFAWLKERATIEWHRKADDQTAVVNREEMIAHLSHHPSHRYDAVAALPHEPMIPNLYYANPKLPRATGEALREFVGALNAETDMDRLLLTAALITPGWGGEAGQRPAFVCTSNHGRGAGKTTTAELIAAIWGGAITCAIDTRDGLDRLRQRILHDSNATKRVVVADNLKGTTNSVEIETLITSGMIDGHKLYSGNAIRPNLLTWFLTANAPSLTRDLADRSILIRLGKPRRTDFRRWAASFVAQHRLQIVADALAILAGPVAQPLHPANRDRWAGWQDAVLSRLPEANAMARLILDRRPGVDQDTDDWLEIEAEVRRLVEAAGHRPEVQAIAVPLGTVAARLTHTTGTKWTAKSLAARLRDFTGCEGAEVFQPNPHKGHGRTWLYGPLKSSETGSGIKNNTVVYVDWQHFNPVTLSWVGSRSDFYGE